MERQRVLVGMSGGVDSSVSAALLVEQGYAVEGVFLKVWSEDDVPSSVDRRSYVVDRGYNARSTIAPPPPAGSQGHPAGDPGAVRDFTACPWEEDLVDARAVADQLGITLHVLNVQREYFTRVVEQMKAGYAAGITPNPDVLCNSEIKFGLLYDWALANHYDYLATGHYARTESANAKRRTQNAKPNQKPKTPPLLTSHFSLLTAADRLKDQTYFLWRVPRERFGRILFPIGHLQKSEVRALAAHFSLLTANKLDSQGICFLGRVNVHDWLRRELGTKSGPVVTTSGQRVGTHEGAALATIGQRRQLGITGGGPVYYVVEKDLATNTLVVDERPAAQRHSFVIGQANWLVDEPQAWFADRPIEVRIRHQGERIPCAFQQAASSKQRAVRAESELAVHCSLLTAHLSRPAFGVAPGQSVVLYSGERVLGGGIIQ